VRPYLDRCFGLTTTVDRLSRVRNERRPGSRYASPEQCRWELRRAADLFRAHRIPVVDSATKSVEEISTHILQSLNAAARARRRAARPPGKDPS
jgi:regulator of PEP synthase PpsR (kinase-PPPase family)